MNEGVTIPLDVPLADGALLATLAWKRGWTPPPILTLSEWADLHRILPQEASKEYGKWRTNRVPMARQIMDDLSVHSPYTEVNFKKSTQVAGTEIGINLVGYVIDHAPGPMMYVLPTIDIAGKFSDQRLQPAFELMPAVRAKLGSRRARDGGNSRMSKKYPAGFLVLSGANSANSLATMPMRYLVLDEISKYPRDLDGQGAAQVQAERRTSSYSDSKKIYRVSSATIKDACAITDEYERGHQAQYHVPCPHCRELQVLVIEQLTDDGRFLCIHCGMLIDESHKAWMLQERDHSADGLACWIPKYPERMVRSYHLWAAYAPAGLGYTWQEIADMRREAKDDPEKEVTFVNTILGEAYAGASEQIAANDVAGRAERWVRRTVPRGCLLLTAFVDVQINRFSIGIWGWGRGDQCWAIDWVELPGDPTSAEDWQQVEDFLAKPLVNACGIVMPIRAVGVDSGNWQADVFRFVRPRQAMGYMATKGMRSQDAPVISRPRKRDSNSRGRPDRRGISEWNLGVHVIKTTLMRRLIKDGDMEPDRWRFHFPADHDDAFYQQLTSERLDLSINRWICPKGTRNEVLDILVGAYAVACSPTVRLHVMRDADWAALESRLEASSDDLFAAPTAPLVQKPVPVTPSTPARATDPDMPAAAPRGSSVTSTFGQSNPFASSDWLSRQ
ncbi:MAG: terminase gpA endonuclease subunit [Rhodanobacter sp.]